MNLRLQRVSELVKQEVSEIVRRDVTSADIGFLTITGAEVAADLKTAKIYFSMIGPKANRGAALALLQRNRGHIQRELGGRITLKFLPHLDFIYDESLERGDHLLQIMDELDRENQKKSS